MNDRPPDHFSSVESRGSASSLRRMKPVRHLYYGLGLSVPCGLIRLNVQERVMSLMTESAEALENRETTK